MSQHNTRQDEFSYRYPHKVHGSVPGIHQGKSLGTGDNFASFSDLFAYPDPRRLDLRATLRNKIASGREAYLVRRYQQRTPITLWVLADLSASMTLVNNSHSRLANLTQLVAHSAISVGDRFALLGFDSAIRHEVSVMPTRQRSMPLLAAEMMANAATADTPGIEGLLTATNMITSSAAIIFLASDFCCDIAVIDKALHQLSRYTVVPLVWQHATISHLPSAAGWTEMADSETGERRSVWLRAKIKKRWQQTVNDHFQQLTECFSHHQVRPLFTDGRLTGDQLTHYFLAGN